MGTVGLSFGSPTSGAGFNVSQTVSSIVANLENVETPWNNQLSSLESQDTVFSTLGTLFSNLTNDMSALTDFQGVLSLKEGSSSDTSVLDLTSASSTAAAGTYSVVVNSLATTANGYLDPISSASDTLTGSIAITTGTGSSAVTTTIDVPAAGSGNDNLQGLANAITSAGIGVTATVLTDANGSRLSLTSNTSGSAGSLSASSSITDSTTGTALNYNIELATGANASLSVNGVTLSSASNTVTNLIPGVTFQLLGTSSAGSEVQVVIANDNSAVESSLEQFVTDYNSLVSAMNAQEGNDSSGNPEPLFGSPTLSLLQQQLLGSINYQNPSGSITGVSSATDTLTGTITINGTQVSVPASGSGNDNISGLAAAINSAGLGVTANVVNDGSGPQLVLVPDADGSTISVTASLTDTTTGASLSYTSNGASISGLTDLGISMNNDGTISLDETSLDSVLNSDYSGVLGFFQDANSWGMTFSNMLNNAGTSNPVGVLKLAENSNSNVESSLNADISRENLLISAQQTSLTDELNSANEILQELPTQLQGVNELYSAITGYNENQNG
jgi:flagellar hook-associated protein 2